MKNDKARCFLTPGLELQQEVHERPGVNSAWGIAAAYSPNDRLTAVHTGDPN
jgi:hypothetical protein